ncbi:protein-methionine-sulfoxide reductase heme-binding subunit MsrQ [Cognatiyoonia sp. IB215446]|uniref:protein-methionine-sulfoxide reductase heme-binding subunit MsrQ n=1 Tax=Cognatiyoonia sp. IB215446 TaxID=3097355 RepID=UPI002A14C430|nr:protein-methionine-sulfoxide reductase heme-binding subunit MsrQ [Cognatiyoonia sp. IB215446]MDX8346506.1 protein-methionine-sulfoxide reductase heme-binding subunit MsrQ [Cognatiyoonia sp. IB215446]
MTPSQAINGALRKVPAWTVYIVCAIWTVWMFYLGLTGGLGVEPINALEREYGELALQLLVLGLLVTPLRKWTGVNLLKFRRAIGVSAFFLVLAHFSVWAVLDVQSVERIWADIVKRPYVTVGMVGFVLMIPLALTSNNLSIRKLGAASWRKLHKLTYPIAVLGGLHYLWLARGFQWAPIIYLAIIGALVATRYVSFEWRRQPA